LVKVLYAPHAREKLARLARVGVTEDEVLRCILEPQKTERGLYGRKVAQGYLTDKLVLRVVYEERDDNVLIITMYPGERRRYG